MASAAQLTNQFSCADFLEFQDRLRQMRTIDDKIVYELNTSLPTTSFAKDVNLSQRCKHLYEELSEAYSAREAGIRKCVQEAHVVVEQHRAVKVQDPDNMNNLKALQKAQTKLRLMQAEMNIEEVVKDRSLKVFYERCRGAYRPPEVLTPAPVSLGPKSGIDFRL